MVWMPGACPHHISKGDLQGGGFFSVSLSPGPMLGLPSHGGFGIFLWLALPRAHSGACPWACSCALVGQKCLLTVWPCKGCWSLPVALGLYRRQCWRCCITLTLLFWRGRRGARRMDGIAHPCCVTLGLWRMALQQFPPVPEWGQ